MRMENPVINSTLIYLFCNSGCICIFLRRRQGHTLHFLLQEPLTPAWTLPSARCPATLYIQRSENSHWSKFTECWYICLSYRIVNIMHWGGKVQCTKVSTMVNDVKTVHSYDPHPYRLNSWQIWQ